MSEPEKSRETGPSEPVEVQTIRRLVRLMHRYDLTAINLDSGDTRIRLRRRGDEVVRPSQSPPLSPIPPSPSYATPTHAVAATPTETPQASTPAGILIESPMVGTYYSSSSPDTPAFVSPGSVIRPDSNVCIIEAMKVFTDIPAQVSGTITEVLVKNGQAVEYGQPLFRVIPS